MEAGHGVGTPCCNPGERVSREPESPSEGRSGNESVMAAMDGERGGSHTCLLSVLAWWVCEGPASQNSSAFIS